jgi:hypothetical protein
MRHTSFAAGILPHSLALVAAAGLFAAARPAAAADAQFVAFDEVFTIVQKGDGGLEPYHHLIKPGAMEPANWVTPVNLSKGTAYLYVEVMKKPSARKTILTMCFDGDREAYGCIDTDSYTAVGNFTTMSPMAEGGKFWNYKAIKWTSKRGEYHIVVKDPGLGGTPGGQPATDFTPTTVRLALTVVPPGGTYVPPTGGGSSDAGAPPEADAGAGTGGSSGNSTGGSSGSGTGGASDSTGTGGSSGSTSSGGSSGSSTGGSSGSTGGSSGSSSTGGRSGGSSSEGSGGSSSAGTGGSSSSSSGSAPAASGCSVAPHGGGASWLLLAGALAAILRRRAPRR